MAGYVTDIEQKTEENDAFRRVLFTGPHHQLVVMTIQPGDEIGMETHDDGDQFVRVESGEGEVVLNGEHTALKDGSAVVVPAGVEHNFVNTGKEPLRLYSVYAPPEHPDGTVNLTKADAVKYDEERHH